MRKFNIYICTIALTLSALSGYSQSGPIKAGENIAVVATTNGKIRGYMDGATYAFKGIPYAKADRFMPPQAPDSWDDVRQSTIYGPQVMQATSQDWDGQGDYQYGFQFNREPMDEKESLVLNVWSQGINDGKKRPVWVWIHGGGYRGGSANQLPIFDGVSLVEKGDIVVVTINHRLNILGYMDLRGLGGKYSESVNLGQQDIVAALKWVKENIANFGGDPNTVTINGQSGGGGKVSTMMAMPSAAGLFHRAIVQSGSTLSHGDGEASKKIGLAVAAALGVNANNAEKLNDFTYEELVAGQRTAMNVLRVAGVNVGRGFFSPSVDGKYITQSPFDPAPSEFSKDVAMLIGTDLNEFKYNNRQIITPKTMDEVRAILTERYGREHVDKYIKLFQKAYPDDREPQHILTFDDNFRVRAIKQADRKSKQDGAPAYTYLFAWQTPVNDGSLGGSHGMELPFMFNNISMARHLTGGGENAYALADKISSAWINFVKTGDPNSKNLPKWPVYTPENGATMIFDNTCKVVNNHDRALMEFVATLPSTSMFGR